MSMVVTAKMRAAEATAQSRFAAKITKAQLCIALADRGLISDADCLSAAKGEWPTAFADLLDYLPPALSRDWQALWAGASEVYRTDQTILALAGWFEIPEEVVDEIFSVAGPAL